MTTDPRYPIGRFEPPAEFTAAIRAQAIEAIADLPRQIRSAVARLTDVQLDTPYRAEGWTVRQLVHHIADSHLNAYVRLKLALTEDRPTIKPYDQNLWADMADSALPIEPSLAVLDGIHARWTALGRSLGAESFRRTFHHPELGILSIDTLLQMYAWHSRHHVAHVTTMRKKLGI